MNLTAVMLDRALADARASRLALYAALDQLHEAYRREQRLREDLREQREMWTRCAERLMANGE